LILPQDGIWVTIAKSIKSAMKSGAGPDVRLWMRTAVRKEITSFGTFLSTLCHEFCHHLDFQQFGFADSWHARGFYERAAALYHHARGTAPKRLFWAAVPGRSWRIDWPRTKIAARGIESLVEHAVTSSMETKPLLIRKWAHGSPGAEVDARIEPSY